MWNPFKVWRDNRRLRQENEDLKAELLTKRNSVNVAKLIILEREVREKAEIIQKLHAVIADLEIKLEGRR